MSELEAAELTFDSPLLAVYQVGKSTLLKSLVKRFTKHNLGEVRGPVTVVSGTHRLLTRVKPSSRKLTRPPFSRLQARRVD